MIGLAKIRYYAEMKKGICIGSAVALVGVGLWFGIMSSVTPPEFGMNGWAFHNSAWITGMGTFALISIAKYSKIPCFFQSKPAWEPTPVRNGGHSEARLVSNIGRYLIIPALW